MISAQLFMLMHLAIIVAILIIVAVLERRERRSWTSWHRGVRYRHLTTEELMRRLRKANR